MFDPTPAPSYAYGLSHRTSDHADPDPVPPLPDAGGLLAAIGLSSHPIREILGNAGGDRARG